MPSITTRQIRLTLVLTSILSLTLYYLSQNSTLLPKISLLPTSDSSISDYTPAPASLGPGVFADPDTARHNDHTELSNRNLRDLIACIAKGNCGKNQRKVVLVTGGWFRDALVSMSDSVVLEAGYP
jgi:hypothetical protein